MSDTKVEFCFFNTQYKAPSEIYSKINYATKAASNGNNVDFFKVMLPFFEPSEVIAASQVSDVVVNYAMKRKVLAYIGAIQAVNGTGNFQCKS